MQFDQIDGREFIVVGGAVMCSIVTRAQQAHMPVIGFFDPRSPDTMAERAFRQCLKNTGYVEGDNIAIEHRSAEGLDDRLSALAADLVRRRVAVIAAASSGWALAAKAATTAIPIVFAAGEDPVRLSLCRQPRPAGRQLDRVDFFNPELAAKRLELLREWCATTLSALGPHCDALASYRNTRFTYLDVSKL
jgi:putative ABC transport system substrate-binding protein